MSTSECSSLNVESKPLEGLWEGENILSSLLGLEMR